MGAANGKPVKEWGRTSLLPLAVSKRGTDTFCASNCDDETVEKVSRPLSSRKSILAASAYFEVSVKRVRASVLYIYIDRYISRQATN